MSDVNQQSADTKSSNMVQNKTDCVTSVTDGTDPSHAGNSIAGVNMPSVNSTHHGAENVTSVTVSGDGSKKNYLIDPID